MCVAGFECPAEYRIAERSVDMQAQNIGFAFRKGNWAHAGTSRVPTQTSLPSTTPCEVTP